MGEEDVARHTHSARQTDDSEEDEKDHFETTKKKNPKTLERHRRQSANRYRHHLESKSSSSSSIIIGLKHLDSSSSSSCLKTEDQQQQQQQQHRSTARRDQLTAYQTSAQASWSTSKAFEVNADAERRLNFLKFPLSIHGWIASLSHSVLAEQTGTSQCARAFPLRTTFEGERRRSRIEALVGVEWHGMEDSVFDGAMNDGAHIF